MKRLFKWTAWLLGVPLLLIALVIGGVAWLAGTDRGFALVAGQAAERVPGLELEGIEGNLLGGVSGAAAGFENDAFDIDVTGLASEWRTGCLLERRFCLDTLVIDEVVFAPKPSDAPAPPPSEDDIVLPEIALPIGVEIGEVLVRRFVFAPPGDAPEQVVENIRLVGSFEGSTVTLTELSVGEVAVGGAAAEPAGPPIRIAADAAGTLELQGGWPIDLDLTVDARDVLDGQDVNVALSLDESVANLALLADVGGALEARLAGTVQPLKKSLPLDLTLTGDALGWPLDTMAQARADNLALTLDGTLEDYALSLVASVTGEQIPPTALDIRGSVNPERIVLPELAVATLGGTVDGTASVNWSDGIDWVAALVLDGIEPGRQVEALDGVLDGRVQSTGRLAGETLTFELPTLSIDGTLNGYPLALDAAAALGEDGVYRIERLQLDNGLNRLQGSGTVGELLDVALTASLPALQNLVPGLAGGFDANLILSGPLTEPSLVLDATSSVVTYQGTVVQGIRLTADVDRAALEASELELAIGEVQVAGQVVQNLRLAADGTRAEHAVTLFADGPQRTAIDLALAGGLSGDLDWAGLLESVRLEVPAHTIVLAEPTALEWDNTDKLFGIDAHCWRTEGTNLCLENEVVAAADGDARITLDRYPLERLNPFLPAESTLNGALGLVADVAWGEAQPGGLRASIGARIDDGGVTVQDAFDEPVSFAYDSLTLDATFEPSEASAVLALDSDDLGSARADITLDPSAEVKPIDGSIVLDGLELSVVRAFVPDLEEIGGTLNIDGELGGELSDPRFDGEISIDAPVVRGEALPLDVTGGRIVADVAGKRATLGGGIDAGGGRIDLDGRANWLRERWRAEVTLTGNDLDIRSDPLQESSVNHAITIVAQPADIRVDGRIDIPMALIDVAELPQGAATLSDDIVVIEDVEPLGERTSEDSIDEVGAVDPPGDTRLRVDLDISLGEDVELDAYGLTANLTGDMSVALRSPNPPQLAGEIEVVDGLFKQYGQNLEASGRVIFVGPVSATRLDIEAIRRIEAEDRIAGLLIEGDIESPDINLFTEPSDKSDEAILSYIVLGRDIGEASEQDASLLSAAALALTVRGGRVVGQGIADQLGIEEFGFETRGNGDDTELVVSGRLNDRLLLKYGQSVFDTQSSLYLRYDLARNLYLEAVEGAEQAVDLFYEFAF